jgi:hypothetical protein
MARATSACMCSRRQGPPGSEGNRSGAKPKIMRVLSCISIYMTSNYIIFLGVAANPQHVRVGGSAGESAGFECENLTKLWF